MDAAVAALLGAAIGAAGSFGAMWIQQRHQTRRERLKLATDLAMHDFNNDVQLAKSIAGTVDIAPLAAYVIYYADMLNELADDDVTLSTIQRVSEKTKMLLQGFPKPHKDRAQS